MSLPGVTITAASVTITTSSSSAQHAIPNTSSGTAPKWLRLVSTQACYVVFGQSSSVQADNTGFIVQPGDAFIVRNAGTNIAALQVTTGGVLNVSPLEDS
jgi:uncharacterized cupin superfamily protein